MKSSKQLWIILLFTCFTIDAKRPPKPPKEPKTPLTAEQKEAIIAGAAQFVSGILAIAQNPHDKHNVGGGIAAIIQGIINIIVEKVGKRKMKRKNAAQVDQLEEYIEQACQTIKKHVIKKIVATTLKQISSS